MYDKKIFSVDGTFRFGHIVIDSADIYFGTVAMRIVDALIRRAKRIAEFFVTLEREGPDWVLMYLERPSWGEPRFAMVEVSDGEEYETILHQVNGVSLRDFAERVIHDLSYPDLADVYAPESGCCCAYYKYDDLMAKITELKTLLRDDHAFDCLELRELCKCKSMVGDVKGSVCMDRERTRASDEEILNDFGMKSFQFGDEWFLTNVDQHEYGPYPSQACAHDAGLLLLDDAKDGYREIPKAECRAEIEKSWSHEGEKVIRLREKGYTDREILCALEMGGERLPVKFS